MKKPTPHQGISRAVPVSPSVTTATSSQKLARGDCTVASRRIGAAANRPITAVPALIVPKSSSGISIRA